MRKSTLTKPGQPLRQIQAQLEKDRLLKLTEVARLLTASLESSTVIQTILETIPQVIPGVDAAALFLYDPVRDALVAKSWVGFITEYIERVQLRPGESMTGYAFSNNRAVLYSGDKIVQEGIENMSPVNRSLQANLTPLTAQSVMCAPLNFKGQVFGVITVNNLSDQNAFTRFDLDLLQSLASQATISIENSRLYEKQRESFQEQADLNRIIRQQASQLEHALNIHKTLASLALQNRGLPVITQALSDILKQPVVILDVLYHPIALAYPQGVEPLANGWWHQFDNLLAYTTNRSYQPETNKLADHNRPIIDPKVVPIQAGNEKLGFICTGRLSNDAGVDFANVAIEQAATIIALEMIKEQSIFEVERRLRGELLEEILAGTNDEHIISRASLVGYDSTCRYWIILADIDDFRGYIQKYQLEENAILSIKNQLLKFGSQMVTQHHPKSIVTFRSDMLVIMLGISSNLTMEQSRQRAKNITQEIKNQLSSKFEQMSFSLVLGRPCTELGQFKSRYQEAAMALQIIGGTGAGNQIVDCAMLGSALLLMKLDNRVELAEFVSSVLGDLIKYDRQHHSDLLTTLTTYSRFNCNNVRVAAELHIHANTLSYRLSRIEEITARTLGRTDDWLDFQLAIRLLQIYPELSEAA
jgi:DNA-binding PucR family transcriptional regulator